MEDVTPAKSPHDHFVAVFGDRQELIASGDGGLVESLGQLQFDQILVEVLILWVVLQQLLPDGLGLFRLCGADIELAQKFGAFLRQIATHLQRAGPFQVGDGAVEIQRAQLGLGLEVEHLSILRVALGRFPVEPQGLYVFSLALKKGGQYQVIVDVGVLRELIVQIPPQGLQGAGVQPGIVETIEELHTSGAFAQQRVISLRPDIDLLVLAETDSHRNHD